jgi:lipopolysaccharide/colanic/teichoic acid biosynthesis glycosyltransferase
LAAAQLADPKLAPHGPLSSRHNWSFFGGRDAIIGCEALVHGIPWRANMTQRHLDLIVAVAGLVLLGPLMLLIALLIRLDDAGPVLFTQLRVGEDRRLFRIYKFRTMRDGWITGIGRWLRATGLDELPQLVNVLGGDMSLIGPRPLTEADVRRLGWDGDAYSARWSVRPGVVGLAQLYAGRGARLSWFLDSSYVRGRSIALDARIVAMSAAVGIVGKRRVRGWLRSRRRGLLAPQRVPARHVPARVEGNVCGPAAGGKAMAATPTPCTHPPSWEVMTGHFSRNRLRETPE